MEEQQLKQEISASKSVLEIQKLHLEHEKLNQEIRHLQRPLWKNPQYIGPIAAIIVAIITVGLAYFNGLFDARKAILENQKLVLQLEIDAFQKQKTQLAKDLDQIQQEKNLAKRENEQLKKDSDQIAQKYSQARGQYQRLRNQYGGLQKTFSREKTYLKKEIYTIDSLLFNYKSDEAFYKIRSLTNKLKGIIDRNTEFDEREFDPDDFN